MTEEAKSKGRKDWWEQDRVDSVGWAFTFIWGALVLLAGTTNFSTQYSWWDGWGVFSPELGLLR